MKEGPIIGQENGTFVCVGDMLAFLWWPQGICPRSILGGILILWETACG